jgi:hypothetical protein
MSRSLELKGERGAGSRLSALQRAAHEGSELQSDGMPQPSDVGYAHFWKGKGKMMPGGCPLFIASQKFNKAVVLERTVEMQNRFNAKKEDRDRPEDAIGRLIRQFMPH